MRWWSACAFVLSLTFVPAMIAVLLNRKLTEKEVKPVRMAKERYGPAVRRAIARPWPVIGAGAGLFAVAAFVFTFLGSEFTPQLDERDIAVQSLRIPSTSLERSLAMQRQVEDRLETFPQVELVFSRTGTAEVATAHALHCQLEVAFPVLIHAILTADSFETAVRANILAGGDNCGRSIPIGAVLGACFAGDAARAIPAAWAAKLKAPGDFIAALA